MPTKDHEAFDQFLEDIFGTTDFGNHDEEVRKETAEALLVYFSNSEEPGSYLLEVIAR